MHSRRGATVVDYALLLGLVGIAATWAVAQVGQSVPAMFDRAANALGGGTVATAPATVRVDRTCSGGEYGCSVECPAGTVAIDGGGALPPPYQLSYVNVRHDNGFGPWEGVDAGSDVMVSSVSVYAICRPN
jgi:Flp pilus assembly pilin Flp